MTVNFQCPVSVLPVFFDRESRLSNAFS
jgi:hypothetical protein